MIMPIENDKPDGNILTGNSIKPEIKNGWWPFRFDESDCSSKKKGFVNKKGLCQSSADYLSMEKFPVCSDNTMFSGASNILFACSLWVYRNQWKL